MVLFLTEAQERLATPPARAVELTVAKNRHGDTGKVGFDLPARSGHPA
jgi:replicative DNA helicase